MSTPATYVERDCVFEADGHSYEYGGAVVTPDYAIGYLADWPIDNSLALMDWHGTRVLGPARIVATWRTPRSYVSSAYHQVEVTIDEVVFTGRCAGLGMIWRGRPKKGKRNDSPTTRPGI